MFLHAQSRLGMMCSLLHHAMTMVVRVPAGLATRHQVDLADPRFVQLYTADDFALDPTDPRFKVRVATCSRHRLRMGTNFYLALAIESIICS